MVTNMRIIISLLLIFLSFISPVNADEDTKKLKQYLETLIDDGYKLFHDQSLSGADRVKESSKLIQSNLYLDWMAKYTLGHHRRNISKEKIKEFSKVYSDFVVTAYADLAQNYDGEKAVLKNIKKIDDNMFIVNMEVVKPGSQLPIKIDYLVHKLKNKKTPYLIGDIITEGISILNSQQSEFNSVISTRGIDALITDLRSRANKS